MSFVSYAQNFEDVMLWRALKHVENGTYVDVGAQHPTIDSVSKAFYLHGWRGIHIEPVQQYAELLRDDRPDEIVLQVALGETDGVLALNVIPETGLSTAIDQYAQAHHEHGFATRQVHVPMLTLKTALPMLAGRDVHWLKIDVEGFEAQVLKGWDSSTLRPWIMVVEATVPGSAQRDYETWDPIIQEAGYRFVYFDGLNRFYVADEHAELVAAFSAPPNVFDAVRLSGYASWGLYSEVEERQQTLLTAAENAAAGQRADYDQLRQEFEAKQTALSASEEKLAALDEERATLTERLAVSNEELAVLAGRLGESDQQVAVLTERLAASSQELVQSNEKLGASNHKLAVLGKQLAASYDEATELNAQLTRLRNENQDYSQQLAAMRATIHEWWSVADRLNQELKAVYASTSWRVTAPLRQTGTFLRGLRTLPSRSALWFAVRIKQLARPLLVWSIRTVLGHSALRERALKIARRHPRLKQYLRGFAGRAGLIAMPVDAPAVVAFQQLAVAMEVDAPLDLPRQIASIYKQLKKQSYKEEY